MKQYATALIASLLLGTGTFARANTPDGLSSSEWNSILAAHDAAKRAIVANRDGTHSAFTPSQRWRVQFDGRGFSVSPNAADWRWGLRLQSYAFGTERTDLDAPASTSSEANRLTYRWDDTLQEWFVNTPNGLLQGWTIARLPKAADPSRLRLVLAVKGNLQPSVSKNADSVSFNTTSGTTALTYSNLHAWDADGKKLPVIFERTQTTPREFALRIDASQARFPITVDPIAQQAYLKASNSNSGDNFGYSVAVSGDTLVIGSFSEASNATGIGGDQTNNSQANAGATYVFVRNGTTWTQQAYLKASNAEGGDLFGYSVSISNNTIVVGAYGEDGVNNSAGASGAAYVFVRNGTTWIQQAYLKASNSQANDYFGWSVAISGDTIVVGADGEDSSARGVGGNQADNSALESGAAYVFARIGSTWTQQAYLKASNTDTGDSFGEAVAISGDTIVVGAVDEQSNGTGGGNNSLSGAGAAYVFVRTGSQWGQEAYLKAPNPIDVGYFGYSVAVSGNTAVVGPSSGETAFVFTRSASIWTHEASLHASNTQAFDYFGNAVAISGDTIVVGATHEDSSATGVNGDAMNNFAFESGAAYIFRRSGSTWTQHAYLKASNTGSNDEFGSSVAIAADTVIVGAWREDSGETGVGGIEDSNDNSAPDAGAAYVFSISSPLPTISARVKTRLSTSRSKVVLRGTSTEATHVEYKAGRGGFKPAIGSASAWRIPVRLKSARTVVSVRATGPGGASSLLKFKIRRK